MKYVERVLQPDETVVHAARLHWLIYLVPVVLLVIAAVCAAFAVKSDKPGIAIPLFLIAALIAPIEVRQFSDVFFDGEAKEAVAFALLAHLHVNGRAGNVPRATGAKGQRILGKLTPR